MSGTSIIAQIFVPLKEIGHEPSGGHMVRSRKISVFIMLSCRVSSSNGNHLCRPTCTLQILSLN